MVRHADGTLHYTINGEDQGVACHNIPPGVFAVVDLYGQVKTQISNKIQPIAGPRFAIPQKLAASGIICV